MATGLEVRDYYHRILPFFEEELRGRGDDDFWAWIASEPGDDQTAWIPARC